MNKNKDLHDDLLRIVADGKALRRSDKVIRDSCINKLAEFSTTWIGYAQNITKANASHHDEITKNNESLRQLEEIGVEIPIDLRKELKKFTMHQLQYLQLKLDNATKAKKIEESELISKILTKPTLQHSDSDSDDPDSFKGRKKAAASRIGITMSNDEGSEVSAITDPTLVWSDGWSDHTGKSGAKRKSASDFPTSNNVTTSVVTTSSSVADSASSSASSSEENSTKFGGSISGWFKSNK